MVKMFKGDVRSVFVVACCAAVMGAVDVSGMEIDAVHISEREQLFALTSEQVKCIKSISFEKQDVDYAFCSHFCVLAIGHNFDNIDFSHSTFTDEALNILNGSTSISLKLTNCSITASNADEILRYVCPYSIKSIDFSYNKLGEQEAVFEQVLRSRVFGAMRLNVLNLKENGFSADFISRTLSYNKLYYSIKDIIF
jgi:hypothetical protein